ncbi:MAG: IS630 family transposase [Bacteroidia bacterium]|nr:IS630 family transposase [Bacteroidia bacterium]
MEKQDARTLSPEAQEQLRKQAIRLRKTGMTYTEISQIIDASRNSVSIWCRQYEEHGASAIKSKKRGIKEGMNRTLTQAQEDEVQRCIIDKMPDQLKLSFALWTRQAVVELIKLRFGITMPIRTVGHYLKRWGFTPQKPTKRSYEQRPEAVRAWIEEEYPAIQERAKAENAEIHWGDETGVRSDSQHGRSYAPKGSTPVVRLSAKYTSVNMISTVTNQGLVRWMIYDGTLNAQVFIKFLKRLIRGAEGRKIFLILDNLKMHHAKIVKEWLIEHSNEIEIFYLPSYSPELNPDEYLNCDLKAGVHSKPPIRDKQKLKDAISSHMQMLNKSPKCVMKYFTHPSIRYAA